MNREVVVRAIYVLFGLACLANGLWMLLDPAGWNSSLRMQVEDFGDGLAVETMMRKLGATYACVSLPFFWCAVNPAIRSRVHPALTLFFLLIAGVQVAEIGSAQVPSHRWVTDAPTVLLPPVILLLLMIPLFVPGWLRARGKTETGHVKWFDARKGFGFIVRDNGEELFVHYRSVVASEGSRRTLADGQRVRFRVGHGRRGPQAEDVRPAG